MRRFWYVGVLVIVLAGGGFFAYRAYSSGKTKPALNYATTVARHGDLKVVVSASGTITADTVESLQPGVAGTVKSLPFAEGQQVKVGDAVVVMDSDQLVSQAAQARVDLQTAQINLNQYLHPNQTDVQAAQLKVQQAALNLQNRRTDLSNLTVTAPLSGTVLNLPLGPGDDVTGGQTVAATVIDDTSYYFDIFVPQKDIGDIKVGQQAGVSFIALGLGAQGTVAKIGGEVQTTGSINVRIALPRVDGLKPGATGVAVISTDRQVFPNLLRYNGTASANDRVDVRPKVSGTVAELLVKEGDAVTAGQPVLRLTNDTLAQAVQQAQNDLATAQNALAKLTTPSSDAAGDNNVKVLQNRVDQARVTLDTKEKDVASLRVTTPVDGTLQTLNVSVGDRITTNQVVAKVATYNQMVLVMQVDEVDLPKVKLGQKVNVTADALPKALFTGSVSKIALEGTVKDGVTNYEVTVRLDRADGLAAGMSATGEILVQEKQDALLVPAEAVHSRNGRQSVDVLDPAGRPRTVSVKTGLASDAQVEITAGVQEGDVVVTAVIQPTSNTRQMRFVPGGPGGMGRTPETGRQGGQNTGNSKRSGSSGGGGAR